jgi:putative hydroxymethylpyrimidine transport system permease protein
MRSSPVTAFNVAIWILGFILIWEGIILLTNVEHFLLPTPQSVGQVFVTRGSLLFHHALITIAEILLGLGIGSACGMLTSLALSGWPRAGRWVFPLLIISQAIPVFAIAPLLVLWFGFGMASKIAMSVLIIYFPVTAAFYDGLRRTPTGWQDLAHVMGGSKWLILRHLRFPAAIPALASGLRIATAVAPIGAVIGEWVGASSGLGYLMLQANARLQTDLMFAALIVLSLFAVTLYLLIDRILRRALASWSTV